MPATVRGFASAANSVATSGTLTINRSSLSVASVAGDLMLAFINYNNQDNNNAATFGATTPTGWTVGKAATNGPSGSDWIVVYKRTANATTADNFVLNYSGDGSGNSNDITGIVVTIQDAGTPTFTAVAGASPATTATVASIGSTGDLLLVNAGTFQAVGGVVSWTTVPSGMTSVVTVSSAGSNQESSVLYSQVLGTAGTRTVTTTPSSYKSALGVAVPYVPAGATLTGSANLISTPTVAASASVTFTATAALTSTPSPAATGRPTLTASAALTTTPSPAATGSSGTNATANLTSTPTPTATGVLVLTASASLTTTPTPTASGTSGQVGVANLISTPSPAATASVTFSATASLTSTPTPAATGRPTLTASATLTSTPVTTASPTQTFVATVALTSTFSTTATGFNPGITTPGTITPFTPTTVAFWDTWATWATPTTYGQNGGAGTITPSTPSSTAYWSTWATWATPTTYGEPVGAATITQVKV